jgi:hypothetical protein
MVLVLLQNLTTGHRSLATAAKPPRRIATAASSVPDPEGSVPKAQAAASPSEQKAWESKAERNETTEHLPIANARSNRNHAMIDLLRKARIPSRMRPRFESDLGDRQFGEVLLNAGGVVMKARFFGRLASKIQSAKLTEAIYNIDANRFAGQSAGCRLEGAWPNSPVLYGARVFAFL